jgi:hypothetical protein
LRYGDGVLEFFEIVSVLLYALCALVVCVVAWFDRTNTKLILPCFVFLGIGLAPVPGWVVVVMPFLAALTLLAFHARAKREPFDYQKHLLVLRDNGALTQAQYEEESARIAGRGN